MIVVAREVRASLHDAASVAALLDTHRIAAVALRDGVVRWANATARSLVQPAGAASDAELDARIGRALELRDVVDDLRVGQIRTVPLTFAANHALVTVDATAQGCDDPAGGSTVLVSFLVERPAESDHDQVRRLEAMLESTNDIITVVDANGIVRYSNGAAGRLTGLAGSDANGLPVLDFVHPEDIARATEAFVRGVMGGEPVDPVDLRLRYADGEWHNVEAEIMPSVEIDGEQCHVITVRDVTERVRRELEAQIANRRLALMVEDIDDVIVILGTDLSVRWASPGIERLVDAPAYTNVGENAFNDMHPDDVPGVLSAIEEVSRAPDARVRTHLRLSHARFGWRWIEASVVNKLDDPAVEGLVCTLRDVTEHRDTDTELRRLREQDREEMARMRADEGAKDAFLATLSHELRTPLAAIRGFSDILERQADVMDAAMQRQLVGRISSNAREMEDMVEQLLDYSRLHAGRAAVDLESLDVDEAIREIVDQLDHSLQSHTVVVEPGGFVALGDRRAFAHVIRNLLTNAARYSPPGSLIEIRSSATSDEVTVDVADQGIGIAPADQARVFKSFFQAAPAATGRRGAGVGLNIARRYAQLQGGRLSLESTLGQGSTFSLVLGRAKD